MSLLSGVQAAAALVQRDVRVVRIMGEIEMDDLGCEPWGEAGWGRDEEVAQEIMSRLVEGGRLRVAEQVEVWACEVGDKAAIALRGALVEEEAAAGSLSVEDVCLQGKAAKVLAGVIRNCRPLAYVSLMGTPLGRQGAGPLGKAVASKPSILQLDASSCDREPEEVRELLRGLSGDAGEGLHPHLQSLVLAGVRLDGSRANLLANGLRGRVRPGGAAEALTEWVRAGSEVRAGRRLSLAGELCVGGLPGGE